MARKKVEKSEYDRIRQNLLKQFNAAKKAGVDVSEIKIPKHVNSPTTASIGKIAEVKSQITKLRRASTFKKRREATREEREKKQAEDIAKEKKRQQYKSYKRREKARKERSRKRLPFGARGDLIIQNFLKAAQRYDASLNFKAKYSSYYSMRDGKVLTAKLLVESAIKSFGETVVAQRITDNAVRFNELFDLILYGYVDEDELDNALLEIEELLNAEQIALEDRTEDILPSML